MSPIAGFPSFLLEGSGPSVDRRIEQPQVVSQFRPFSTSRNWFHGQVGYLASMRMLRSRGTTAAAIMAPAELAHGFVLVCGTTPTQCLNVVVPAARSMVVMRVSLDKPLQKGKCEKQSPEKSNVAFCALFPLRRAYSRGRSAVRRLLRGGIDPVAGNGAISAGQARRGKAKRIERREFLRRSIAGAGGLLLGSALGAEDKAGTVDPYATVPLGKTKLRVSREGCGD